MENRQKLKVVSVEVEGKKYDLAYSFNVIADVEAEAGCNLLDGLRDLANMSAMQLRGLLCAALRAVDPKSKSRITVEQVSSLLRYDTIYPFSEGLAKSILASLPDQSKNTADDPTSDNEVL